LNSRILKRGGRNSRKGSGAKTEKISEASDEEDEPRVSQFFTKKRGGRKKLVSLSSSDEEEIKSATSTEQKVASKKSETEDIGFGKLKLAQADTPNL